MNISFPLILHAVTCENPLNKINKVYGPKKDRTWNLDISMPIPYKRSFLWRSHHTLPGISFPWGFTAPGAPPKKISTCPSATHNHIFRRSSNIPLKREPQRYENMIGTPDGKFRQELVHRSEWNWSAKSIRWEIFYIPDTNRSKIRTHTLPSNPVWKYNTKFESNFWPFWNPVCLFYTKFNT